MIKFQLSLVLLTGTVALACVVPPVRAQSIEAGLNRLINISEPIEIRTAADVRLSEGQRLAQSGNLKGAISLWQESLFLYDHLQDLQGLTQTYEYLGLNHVQLNQWPEAEHAFRQQLAIARSREDFQSQIYALNNLGMMLLQNLNLGGAEDTLKQALVIAKDTGNLRGQGLSLSNLGLVIYNQGNHQAAINLYQQSLAFRQRIQDYEGLTNTYNNLGDAYLANQDYWGGDREPIFWQNQRHRLGRF
ncbi:MAG: tetratricopeptide repeat protein [Synechococcaceae cyanobacterium RL_1_2]|nr:tetratricopeptide repeat protein [Synechococcaceae cyanobacterium RL_1_2]